MNITIAKNAWNKAHAYASSDEMTSFISRRINRAVELTSLSKDKVTYYLKDLIAEIRISYAHAYLLAFRKQHSMKDEEMSSGDFICDWFWTSPIMECITRSDLIFQAKSLASFSTIQGITHSISLLSFEAFCVGFKDGLKDTKNHNLK